jgi:hypothetical protein
MIFSKELREVLALITRMLGALQKSVPTRGVEGSEFRRVCGNFLAHDVELVEANTIGTKLFECFEQARIAGAGLSVFDTVRETLLLEQPLYSFGRSAKLTGMVFSFVEQCTIISKTTFFSRTDVDAMIIRMAKVIETLKLEVAELLDGMDYRNLTALASMLTQHLAVTERKMPRVVEYEFKIIPNSLYLANYLYGEANNSDRSDELEDENKVIHPAFFPRTIRALSQ